MQVDTNNMNEEPFCSPAHMRTLEGTGRAAEGATADRGEPDEQLSLLTHRPAQSMNFECLYSNNTPNSTDFS